MFVLLGSRTPARIAASITMLLVIACSEKDPAAESSQLAVAVLKGVVTTEVGSPVAGAILEATIEDTAVPGSIYGPQDVDTTDVSGRFIGRIQMPQAPEFIGRVVVTVTPPSGSGLMPNSITIPALRFRPAGAPDTAEIEVTLAQSP